MIITDKIKVKVNNSNRRKYSNLGYDISNKEEINISIEDLPKSSIYKVKVCCDYCGEHKEMTYKYYNNQIKDNGKYACSKCGNIKQKELAKEKWGVGSYFETDKFKEQSKKYYKDNYGVIHNSQIPEIRKQKSDKLKSQKNRIRETINNYWNSVDLKTKEEINEKRKITNKKRYGVDNVSKLESTKEKVLKTSIENYGGIGFSSEVLSNRINKTLIDLYGVNHIMELDEVKEKIKQTNINKYGFSYPFLNPEIKEKALKNLLDDKNRKRLYKITQDNNYIKYVGNGISEFKCDCGKNHLFKINTDNYFKRLNRNVPLCTECYPISENSSIKEKVIKEFIKDSYKGKIIENYRDGKEIDIFLPELSIGFEFNGLYWHSDLFKENTYHLDKIEHFKSKGIRIYHIWEDDYDNKIDIIKSQILNWIGLNNNKIYARKCEVKEIKDTKLVRCFLDDNHIQGFIRSTLKIGIFYNDDLISLATFDHFEGRKSMNKDEWNISRFCSKKYVNVIGGFSKIIKYFEFKYKPKRLITFADYSWSDGNLYKINGFDFIKRNKCNYSYILNGIRTNKQRFTKKKLIKDGFEKELSENEIMESLNIYKIYDSGQLKFEKKY